VRIGWENEVVADQHEQTPVEDEPKVQTNSVLATSLSAHEPAALHDHGSATLGGHGRRSVVIFELSPVASHRAWCAALVAVVLDSSGTGPSREFNASPWT
jgi:hypothetical protein